jgi:hypothetical protein
MSDISIPNISLIDIIPEPHIKSWFLENMKHLSHTKEREREREREIYSLTNKRKTGTGILVHHNCQVIPIGKCCPVTMVYLRLF